MSSPLLIERAARQPETTQRETPAKKAAPAAAAGRDQRLERMVALITVVTPFLGVAAAAAYFWNHGVGLLELSLLGVFYFLTVVGLGTGFHRLFSHRSFQTITPIRVLFAILGSMGAEGPVLYWAAIHRKHHQFSDEPGDPHSPHLHGEGWRGRLLGLWHAHIGWLFDHEQLDWARWSPDLLRDRAVFTVHRYYFLWVALGLLLPAVVGGILSLSWSGALTGFIWGGLVRMFLAHHTTWSVNSFSHVWGAKRFRSRDESRNNVFLALLTMGDGWHNNHHAFPTSAAHGLEWWQFDMSHWLIRGLEVLGLAWDVKRPSREALAKARV